MWTEANRWLCLIVGVGFILVTDNVHKLLPTTVWDFLVVIRDVRSLHKPPQTHGGEENNRSDKAQS